MISEDLVPVAARIKGIVAFTQIIAETVNTELLIANFVKVSYPNFAE